MNFKHSSNMGKSWSYHKVGVKISFPTFTSQELFDYQVFKARLSPSKKNHFICLIENPLKMMKNTLETLFVLKIFKFLS